MPGISSMSSDRVIEDEEELLNRTKAGDVDGVRTLLDQGISVNAESYCGRLFFKSTNNWAPLHWAAFKGRKDICQLLIQHNACVDSCDMYDVTPAHLAAEAGHVDCLQLLIDYGASVNQTTLYKLPQWGITKEYPYRGGTTALHLATRNNHLDCVQALFDAGADYNAEDEDGRTSLYIAAERKLESAVLFQLENALGKPLMSVPIPKTGDTALHQCVLQSMMRAIPELLVRGSDVNHLNKAGYSPLHLALQMTPPSLETITMIVMKGYRIDLNLKDAYGVTPLEYVCFLGSKLGRLPHLAAMFIAYGAQFTHLKCKKQITLLEQELQNSITDSVILSAIVKSLVHLPQPDKLRNVNVTQLRRRNRSGNPDLPGLSGSVAKLHWYKRMASSVRSLQHHCRVTIRNHLGPRRLNVVHELPIPKPMQDYLLFKCERYEEQLLHQLNVFV